MNRDSKHARDALARPRYGASNKVLKGRQFDGLRHTLRDLAEGIRSRRDAGPGALMEDCIRDAKKLIQNPPPSVFPLEELVKETHANPLIDLYVADPTSLRVENVEFGPERTLKINSSLSTSQEKELCSLLKNHLDAFAWDYKEMKGVHPSI